MKSYFIQDQEFTRSELEIWAWRGLHEGADWEKGHYVFLLQWMSRTPSISVYTSGSTGPPKVITLSRSAMESSARATAEYLNLGSDSQVLMVMPSTYIAGKMMLVRALVNGWKLRWVKPASDLSQELNSPIDFVAMTPMQAIKTGETGEHVWNQVRTVLLGGAPVSTALRRSLPQSETRFFESYGMTETASHVALKQLHPGGDDEHFKALPGYHFSCDHRGCLTIHAPSLGHERLVTNDLVDLIDPNTFDWTGRIDHIINTGGIKVIPEKIEKILEPLLNCPFYIGSVEDPVLGQKVTLFIEAGTHTIEDCRSILQQVASHMLPAEVPRHIVEVDHLGSTEGGKLKRNGGSRRA